MQCARIDLRFRLVLLLMMVVFRGIPLWSATQNALVTGRVTDLNGEPVSEALVVLQNPTIGFRHEQVTDANGSYTFQEVPPVAGYRLNVRKEDFEPEPGQPFSVTVNQLYMVRPPIVLTPVQVAAVTPKDTQPIPPQPIPPQPTTTQPITPQPTPSQPTPPPTPGTAAPPPPPEPRVLTDLSTARSGVIESDLVHTLPLRDRDFIDLALLVPGTYPVEQGSALEGASLVVNGVRANMNNFLLDGADNNDYTINQSLPFQIVEAMQEFRVQASTNTADFGRSGGAQINLVSNRGVNSVHGTLFEFNRNSALSAESPFSVYSGGTFDQYARWYKLQGLGDPLNEPALDSLYNRRKAQSNQNQFGGNVGGALKKDKLFGFFNYEGFRVSNPRPIFERVPENCLRDDDLFQYNPSADPSARRTCIPGSSSVNIDPIALKLYNLYPAPNVPVVATSQRRFSSPLAGPAFFVGESTNRTQSNNYLGRLDWQGERSSLSFKYNAQNIDQIQGGAVPLTPNYPGSGDSVSGLNQNFSFGYVRSIKAKAVNELRLAWNRFALDVLPLDRTIDPTSLGLKNLNFTDGGLPTLNVGALGPGQVAAYENTPYARLGSDLRAPNSRANNVWSIADNLSLVRGRHNLKFGFEYRFNRLNTLNEAVGRGLLGFFDGTFVAATGQPDIGSIARVSPEFGGGFDRDFRTHSLNWFVQDQWQVHPTFSINLGLRYELNTAPVEQRDRLVNYYPNLNEPVRAGAGVPRAGFDTDKQNYGPRIGLAWNPGGGNTVVRGAYGILFDQQPLEPSINMLLNPPFVYQDFSYYCSKVPTSLCTEDLLPIKQGGFVLADTFGVDSASSSWLHKYPYSFMARDSQTRTSYVQQFNFGFQQQLGNTAVAEAAYVGSLGRKLPRLRDISLLSSILNQENTANSTFHSFQLGLKTPQAHGLQIGVLYQWAKSIDNASSLRPQTFVEWPVIAMYLTTITGEFKPGVGYVANGINPATFTTVNSISPTLSLQPRLPIVSTRPTLPQDSANLGLERGLSDFDIRHRLVVNYWYNVPKWDRLGVLGKGWAVAGVTKIQSGQPYTVFVDSFGLSLRPDVRGSVPVNNRNSEGAIDNGTPLAPFETSAGLGCIATPNSAFDVSPNCGLQPGSSGRNTFSGPGLVNFDFSILKDTALGSENRRLQFRAEFFNFFNHSNFYQPYSRGGMAYTNFIVGPAFIPDPFFGKILQARPAQEIQFGLKFIF